MRLTKSDVRVIRLWLDGKDGESAKLYTDADGSLHGDWIGGRYLAQWVDGKIRLPDLGSKAAQTVQSRIKKEAAPNDVEGFARKSNPMNRFPRSNGKVLVTTQEDRELLMLALESAIYVIMNRRQRGEALSPAEERDQAQLEELYNRIYQL
jgi:hypothetical protein